MEFRAGNTGLTCVQLEAESWWGALDAQVGSRTRFTWSDNLSFPYQTFRKHAHGKRDDFHGNRLTCQQVTCHVLTRGRCFSLALRELGR